MFVAICWFSRLCILPRMALVMLSGIGFLRCFHCEYVYAVLRVCPVVTLSLAAYFFLVHRIVVECVLALCSRVSYGSRTHALGPSMLSSACHGSPLCCKSTGCPPAAWMGLPHASATWYAFCSTLHFGVRCFCFLFLLLCVTLLAPCDLSLSIVSIPIFLSH